MSFALETCHIHVLVQSYIWHTKREENRLRRKLLSIESKCEQSRNQIASIRTYMKQHQNGIDVHLKKLSKTENTLRQQIDTVTHTAAVYHNTDHVNGKRAKILNNDLIEIVQHRNDHESRLDSSQSTFKLISALLNDETKLVDGNGSECDLLLQLDENISKSISEYIYYRQQTSQIQNDLVECVEKRELANRMLYKLNKQLNNINMNNNDDDNSDIDDDNKLLLNKELLKNEVIKLAQDIHQRSGLIRQQKRNGICYLRVFVGSELITWMVKSDIVCSRNEALILSSLLIDFGYIYTAYHEASASHLTHSHSHRRHNKKSNKTIKVFPSISLKPKSASAQHNIKTQSAHSQKAPNKLLLGASDSCSSCISSPSNCGIDSTPSSVLSMTSSSLSTSPSNISNISSNISNISNVSNSSSLSNANHNCLSFNDSNDLYRFKVDDSRIERISKMGFLEKIGRFRSKKRHYIWDGVTKQLREYKTKGDTVSLCRYSFNKETQIKLNPNDECVLVIVLSSNRALKLKAASSRERDSWLRVMSDIETITTTTTTITTTTITQYNNNYEEYRHLRMINRLKWSSLIKCVGSKSVKCNMIIIFREFILKENSSSNKLSSLNKVAIEQQVNKLFQSKTSPIFNLFESFSDLFLEPFAAININHLSSIELESIKKCCVDDLISFLEIAQNRLINLLVPVSLRMRRENKPNHVIKLLYKLIKSCIYYKCFSSAIYKKIFTLYQRIHYEIDNQLYKICKSVTNLSTKHYQISEQLQIDKTVTYKKGRYKKSETRQDFKWNEITKWIDLDPLQFEQLQSESIQSPFEPCFDKMKSMTQCCIPSKKLQCLVQLQQEIICCIDNYRQNNYFVINNNENYNSGDNEKYEEKEIRQIKGRTHGIMDDNDEDDINVSLISYESTQSEIDKHKVPKCKQLLIASDDMIPLFCFVLVQSEIKYVHAEIEFMNDFMSVEEKQMKSGFYLTTLQAASSALLDKKLPII